jgi:prepilin-type N-terminal cleavage/methylation domain-containing protein
MKGRIILMEKLMRLIKLSSRSGFTLVELLIVVFILAVLAAIVLPRFNSSTDEAKEAALRSSLLEMRNAIELYYHQHNNVYPGFNKTDGTGKTTIDAEGQTAFFNQLTLYTDVNGKTAVAKDLEANPQIRYGPYLKRSTLPVNPIDGSAHVTLLLNNAALDQHDQPPAPRAGDSGWWFNVVSGKFVANTPGSGIDGTPYYLW